MYFATAGIDVSPFLPPLAAFVVSLLTSMGGISGAFLLLPFQISVLGCVNPSVSATNQLYNVVATPGGVWRYVQEGRMLLPLARTAALASLPGVVIGAGIRLHWLADPARFQFFAGLVLLYLALRMTQDLTRGGRAPGAAPGAARPEVLASGRRVRFRFMEQEYAYDSRHVFLMTAGIGLVGGIYGIGGGAFLAPFLVSFCGLPIHVTAGATLLCTLVTSVGGVLAYLALAPLFPELSVTPDWALGLLMGVGGLLGMNAGARLQKYIPARPVKLVLTVLITGTALAWLLPLASRALG